MSKKSRNTTPPKTPGNLNPRLRERWRREKHLPGVETFVDGILEGNRVLLGQAITLIESRHPQHQQLGQAIIEKCLPAAGQSLRVGVTGAPGVGKSTFIEALGSHLLTNGRRLAVLAIDPSSQVSGGSILGDKTRMEKLGQQEAVFIRPSPAGDSLGGVARKTRETVILCEAAGYDTIIIETVGVGQSETAVRSMVDFFLLLLLPGAGDELQGIKRGIVEMADLLAVNKADGDRQALARRTSQEYRNALHLFPAPAHDWIPAVLTCSAITGEGMAAVWEKVLEYEKITRKNGYFAQQRRDQAKFWLYETINARLRELFYQHPEVQKRLAAIESAVLEGQQTSFRGADELIRLFTSP